MNHQNDVYSDSIKTSIGFLNIYANTVAVEKVMFAENPCRINSNRITAQAQNQLQEYLQGARKEFTLPLQPKGTEFQHRVWAELCNIKWGQTASYLHIATQLNKPTASRAVGSANGKNPIPIIIPCHRIIGANGALTGYAGGLPRKTFLLTLENAL